MTVLYFDRDCLDCLTREGVHHGGDGCVEARHAEGGRGAVPHAPAPVAAPARMVDIRLPGKDNSNSHGARPVYENHLDDGVDSDQ